MRLIKNLSFAVFFLGLSIISNGQDKASSNLNLQKASKAYESFRFSTAAIYFQKYLKTATSNGSEEEVNKTLLKIADCYWNIRDYQNANLWYSKVPSAFLNSNPLAKRRLSELLAGQENYQAASTMLSTLPEFSARAKGFNHIDEMKADSADWSIRYLDLNTPYYKEFSPLVINNSFLWSTNEPVRNSLKDLSGWDGNSYTYISSYDSLSNVKDGTMPSTEYYDTANSTSKVFASRFAMSDNDLLYNARIPMALIKKRKSQDVKSTPIISDEKVKFNVANPSYSAAINKVFFSVNNQSDLDKNQVRMVGIAEANIDSNVLSKIKFLALGGSNHNVMHPAIHPNGQSLVFASNQTGGKGDYDLYYVKRIDDTSWTNPSPLTELNTAGNELFPSFSPKGQLLFASDGHPGFGGLDIYRATIEGSMSVKNVYHLPTPVNSPYDDFSLVYLNDETKGFFTSDRFGQDDILGFDYEIKIVKLSGYVVSRYTEMRKPGVKIILQNKTNGESMINVGTTLTDSNGDFVFEGRPNNEYLLTIDNGGDDIQKTTVSTRNVFASKPLGIFYVDKKKEIVVEAPKPKADTTKFVIYFAFDKSSLTNKAKRILNQAAALINSNPDLKAILDGHTDLWGGDDYNMDLSNKRVKEACKYFSKIGLSESQADCSQYYGKQRPVYNTLDKAVSVKNRRVEIFVTNK
jgi:outer membrane protein OmpA-like peptidoglycan-associated protein